MNLSKVGMSVIIAVSLAGCAAGPKIAESGAITTTVPKGKSQVVVYRDGLVKIPKQRQIWHCTDIHLGNVG